MDANSPLIYEFGAFRLDLTERLLTQKGKPIALTPKAFEVLAYLVERPGHLVEKEELIQEVWVDSFVEEANLSRTIWMLRRALGEDRNGHKYIETIPKYGYRFVADVKVVETAHDVTDGADDGSADTRGESVGLPQVGGDGAAFAEEIASNDLPETVTASSLANTVKSVSEADNTGQISSRYRLFMVAGVAAVLLLVFSLIFLRKREDVATVPITSIAVIPLDNLSGDPAQDSFADAMTEVLNTELGKIRQLRVIERTATSRYRTTQKGVSEIAHELNVGAVARGAAMRIGDRIRITIQLYRGDGQNLWSQSYDRPYDDVLNLQNSIAKTIASEIRVNLSAADQADLAEQGRTDPIARDAFLRGVEYYTAAQNMPNTSRRTEMFLKAVEPFEQAISIEPDYINAHEKLMQTYHFLAGGAVEDPNAEYWRKSVDEAKVLLKLDPENSIAHTTLAIYSWRYNWDRAEAEKEFSLAFKDRADSAAGRAQYALFLSADGRQDEAIESMKRAIEINPSSDGMKMNMGNLYTRKHDYGTAIEYLTQLMELNPQIARPRNALSRAYACKGMYSEAVKVAEKDIEAGDNLVGKIYLAWIYARSGDRDSALRTLNEVLVNTPPADNSRGPFETAGVYAELGDKDLAFKWLERAYIARASSLVWLKADPEMDKLRDDPRYADLLKRIGLSP